MVCSKAINNSMACSIAIKDGMACIKAINDGMACSKANCHTAVEVMVAMELRKIQAKPVYAIVNFSVNNNYRQVILIAVNFYYTIENE